MSFLVYSLSSFAVQGKVILMLFPPLTDIIGPHAYGRENSLSECLSSLVNTGRGQTKESRKDYVKERIIKGEC